MSYVGDKITYFQDYPYILIYTYRVLKVKHKIGTFSMQERCILLVHVVKFLNYHHFDFRRVTKELMLPLYIFNNTSYCRLLDFLETNSTDNLRKLEFYACFLMPEFIQSGKNGVTFKLKKKGLGAEIYFVVNVKCVNHLTLNTQFRDPIKLQ